MELKDIKAVYFVGAGGIGMSAIARYFLVVGGDGRGIDHETVVFVLAHVGDFRYILLVVDEHTLTFELSGEV